MIQIESQYNRGLQNGTWNKPPKDGQILALQATNAKLAKQLKEQKQEGETKKNKPPGGRSLPPFMDTLPKTPDEIKTHNGKQWNYCNHHAKWVLQNPKSGLHTTQTCKLSPLEKKKSAKKECNKSNKKKTKKTVQVNQTDLDTTAASNSDSYDSDSTSNSSSDEEEKKEGGR